MLGAVTPSNDTEAPAQLDVVALLEMPTDLPSRSFTVLAGEPTGTIMVQP